MAEEEKEFLTRWSRRKAEAQEKLRREDGPEKQTADEAGPDEENAAADSSEFDDVDFDALDYGSDFTRFMKKGVPDIIQRRALRKLWSSDPILANLDGLNDYDEDFTDAALAVKAIKTAYKVGRGYLTDEDLEPDKAAAAGESAQQDDDAEVVSSPEDSDVLAAGEAGTASHEDQSDDDHPGPPDGKEPRKA